MENKFIGKILPNIDRVLRLCGSSRLAGETNKTYKPFYCSRTERIGQGNVGNNEFPVF